MTFENLFDLISPLQLVFAFLIAFFAGFVKGSIGFAMPVIILSGLGSFLSPELALVGLMMPTLLSNLWQSLRGGLADAIRAVKDYYRYIVSLLVMIVVCAQLVTVLSASAIFLILGVVVVGLALLLLSGYAPHISTKKRKTYDILVGGVSGAIGGVTGVWGPLTVTYLTAINTPKKQHIKVAGVVFGSGAVMLLLAHIQSGVMNMRTLPLSLALVPPALLGMAVGNAMQDRLDQKKFRSLTLFVLVLVGLNLIRRGLV